MSKLISAFSQFYKRAKAKFERWLAPRVIKVKLKQHDSIEFYLYNPPFQLETDIYWRGWENINWESQTRLIWADLCTKSKLIFDIGANTGIFSILAKAHNHDSTVIAFEPQPNIYNVLQKNNEINNFDIHCENIALSDRIGSLPFYNYGKDPFGRINTTAGSLNQSWRENDQKSIEVEVTTLDSFLKDRQIKSIDLIKIDVESYEPQVLKGYKQHLHLHRPIIILEILDIEVGKRIQTYFEGESYIYFNIHESDGLRNAVELGKSKHGNYLLCPEEKQNLISLFTKM